MLKKRVSFTNINLKTKLVFLYLVTIIVPLLIISQVVLSISTNKIISQTTDISKEATSQISTNIQSLLSRYIDISNNICFADSKLKQYLSVSNNYEILENLDMYNNYLGNFGNYVFNVQNSAAQLKIYFLNPTILADSSFFFFADDSFKKTYIYKQAIENGNLLAWGLDNPNKLYLSRVMKDEFNNILAIVVITIPEEMIYSQIKESGVDGKTILIVDEKGNVISSSDRKLVGTSIEKKQYFSNAMKQDLNVFNYTENITYKVITSNLKTSKNLPKWRVIATIPLDKIMEDGNIVRNNGFILCILSLLLSCGIFIFSLDKITVRIKVLVMKMHLLKEGKFSTIDDKGSSDEIGEMTKTFNIMVESLEHLIYENYQADLQLKDIALKKRESELYVLQSQINPHFLFNTLESIRMGLHNKGDEETERIILHLSKIFQKSLYWEGEFIPLSQELEFVRNYLEIQKYRFKGKIYYNIDIPNELLGLKIPKLTIQPIIENAIKHGIEPKWGKGNISVTAAVTAVSIVIRVEDDGVGMNEEILERVRQDMEGNENFKKTGSIGMKNVNDRMVLHYGPKYGLRIDSIKEKGTFVYLEIPILGNS